MVRRRAHAHTVSRCLQTLPTCLPTRKTSFLRSVTFFSKNYSLGSPKTFEGARNLGSNQVRIQIWMDFGPNFENLKMVRRRPHAHTVSRCLQTLPTCLPTLKTSFLRVVTFVSKNYSLGSSKSSTGRSKERIFKPEL